MTDRSDLAHLVEALAGVRVLCIGDVMLDRFVYGRVERISPEAPIPVVKVDRETAMLGGAGNVVRNLVALGARVDFLTALGDDEAGAEVRALLAAQGRVQPVLAVEPRRPTTIKTRFVAGGQQLMRADRETTRPVTPATRRRILDAARKALGRCQAVVLSDYGKGVLGAELVCALIAAARAAGRPVIVDPKGTDYGRYRGANILTPNRKELHEAVRLPVDSDEQIVAAARQLIASCGLDALLATRSQDGMTLVVAATDDDGEAVTHLPAEAREVFDVSGAGDTVVASVAAALAAGAGLVVAATLANVAAGVVVGKAGTAVVREAELVAALHHQDLAGAEAKLVPLDVARERVAAWRRQGLAVGFTNGCFDLLHPGHIATFRKARAHCDRLVVGLNSDGSVKRLKGPERPVQNEAARGTVLASLEQVDLVVVFDEDTPYQLIDALRPDVLVKGADYAKAQVVGADIVEADGGKVVLVDLEPGHSTTATIARMGR